MRVHRQSHRARLRAALLASSALVVAPAAAQDAAWNGPGVQWTSAGNWLPGFVPTGIATFNGSGSTNVTISSNAAVAQIDFTSATLYSLKINAAALFQVTGPGITGSGTAPAFTNLGGFQFSNSSTAGGATIVNNNNGVTTFLDLSSAGTADITNKNGGATEFRNDSTASLATITNRDFSATSFFNASTAASAVIVNNGGVTNFLDQSTAASADITNRNGGATFFGSFAGTDTASAGNATITNRETGGATIFQALTTAGNATIVNNGGNTSFFDGSNAGTATITNKNGGSTIFEDHASAMDATIDNRDGCICTPSTTTFAGSSDAGTATITNKNIGVVQFVQDASAANAIIVNDLFGATIFGTPFSTDAPTAGNATIINKAGGVTQFGAFSTAADAKIITRNGGATGFFDNSTGGNAQFITRAGGIVDFSQTIGPAGDGKITAGSIAGAGDYYLGGNQLTVGSNNLSTTVSGTINDGVSPLVCGCAPPSSGASLVKTGTGTLILSGINTYSGGTTFAGGTLSVSQEANLGALSGALTFDGGVLQITGTSFNSTARAINWGASGGGFDIADAANTFTVAQTLSGPGGLAKLGPGTLVLTGANTYSGGTTIAGGALSIGANNNIGTGPLTMLNGTTLQFTSSFTFTHPTSVAGDPTFDVTAGNTVTMAGAISDGAQPGEVVKSGTGTLILSANNTYSGGTTISAGRLDLGDGGTSGSILGNVINNAILSFNRSNNFMFDGVISGTGAVQQNGTGATLLTATSSYTGATTVNAGTLIVNGSIATSSGLTVNTGATVSGTGILPTTTINSGGTLSPGNSVGTITVNGNLTFNAGSTYLVEVSPTAADRINVTGTATLSGTVNAIFQGGSFISNTFTILSATGGHNGTFGTLITTNLPSFLTASLDYTPANAVLMTLTSGLAQITGTTANQKAVAGGLDNAFNSGGGLFPGFASLAQSQIPAALDALSGEIHASVRSGLIDDSRFVRQAILGRLRQAPYAGASGAMAVLGGGGPMLAYSANGMAVDPAMAYAPRAKDAYAADFPVKAPRPAAAQPDPEMAFWGQAFGAWGRFDGDGNAADAKRTLGGFMSGFDRSFGDWRAGLAGGYSHSNLSVSARASSASVESFHIAGYAGSTFGAFNLRSGAAFSAHDIDTGRSIVLPGFTDQTHASYDGSTAQAFGELGYVMTVGQVAAEPFAGLSFVRVATDAFREVGGAAALGGVGESHQVGYSSIGARAATSVTMANGMVVMPRASLAWQHAFSNVTPTATLAFLGTGAGFTVAGVPLARDSALAEAGFDVVVRPNATLGLSYSGQLADNVRDHAVKANATLRF